MTLQQHVEDIAYELGVPVDYSDEDIAHNYYENIPLFGTRRISIHPIREHVISFNEDVPELAGKRVTEVTAYFSAMHELGHAADRDLVHSLFATPEEVLDQEARAWLWALDNAIVPVDSITVWFINAAIQTYCRVFQVDNTPQYNVLAERVGFRA